jgi:hypothetical protein
MKLKIVNVDIVWKECIILKKMYGMLPFDKMLRKAHKVQIFRIFQLGGKNWSFIYSFLNHSDNKYHFYTTKLVHSGFCTFNSALDILLNHRS